MLNNWAIQYNIGRTLYCYYRCGGHEVRYHHVTKIMLFSEEQEWLGGALGSRERDK